MPLLDVNDLTTYFHTRNGVVRAVDGVSFQLEKGETLGIVGESGSGKSVTCMSMLGLIPQPPGRIEKGTANFDGTDLLHCSQKELQTIRGRRIAMIFQDPMTSLNPYLRIEDQLIEPLLIHGLADKVSAKKTGARDARRRRHSGRRQPNAWLSARILRRNAPARDDRHGTDHQTGCPDC